MNLIEREPASHWYLADGTPFYEVDKKDGSGKPFYNRIIPPAL